jgi:hypothetical protein
MAKSLFNTFREELTALDKALVNFLSGEFDVSAALSNILQ